MRLIRTLRALVVAAVIAAFLAFNAGVVVETPSVASEAPSLAELRAQAIYFTQKGRTAERDLAVGTMAQSSDRDSRLWAGFVESWTAINKYMKMNSAVPKDLPKKGHVFVVLGSALKKTGKLSRKFEERLEVTLKALKAYPTSKVLVSGGAPKNGHTEGEVGSAWLAAKGIATSRILVEKKSASTIGNAKNSMAMLAKSDAYTSYSLISDSSHLRRASILFDAAAVLVQEKSGANWDIQRLENVAYMDMKEAGKVPLKASSVAYAASNVASLFSVLPQYKKLASTPPAEPALTAVKVTAPSRVTYAVGERLSTDGLKVKAVYNKGEYTKVVTTDATISGFDSSRVGKGTATASYTESDVTRSATFTYKIVKASSAVGVKLSTKKVKRKHTRVKVTVAVTTASGVVPTGKVRFYLDGKRLKTTKLDADASAVSFRYPKIAKTGKHRFSVKYLGDSRLDVARASITVKVKK